MNANDNLDSDSNPSEDDLPLTLKRKIIPQRKIRALIRERLNKREINPELTLKKKEEVKYLSRDISESHKRNYSTLITNKIPKKVILPQLKIDYNSINRKKILEAIPEREVQSKPHNEVKHIQQLKYDNSKISNKLKNLNISVEQDMNIINVPIKSFNTFTTQSTYNRELHVDALLASKEESKVSDKRCLYKKTKTMRLDTESRRVSMKLRLHKKSERYFALYTL